MFRTCAILLLSMNFLKLLRKKQNKKGVRLVDFYQDSIEKIGSDQIKKMVERGISIPVVML